MIATFLAWLRWRAAMPISWLAYKLDAIANWLEPER